MCVCVCAFVCQPSYLQINTSDLPRIFCACYPWGRGSVLLSWRNDILRISGFMDDVTFAYKLRLLDVAAKLRQ